MLIAPTPYAPLPTSAQGYVPVLQDHLGERCALSHASPTARAVMTPLLEVVPRGSSTSHEAIKARVKALAVAVRDQPVYLDIKKLSPTATIATTQGQRPLLALALEAARKRSMQFMPVAWTTREPAQLEIVAEALERDGHGAALRHPIEAEELGGPDSADLVRDALVRMAAAAPDIDLMLDAGYLRPDDEMSVRWLKRLIDDLSGLGRWRSIVLLATSVQPSFGGGIVPEQSVRELPRLEWPLWRRLNARLDRPVAFGDYAVQNPTPPPDPPKVGPWGNVRYTAAESLVVARGVNVRTEGYEQYKTLCGQIVEHPAFRGSAFSYGDRELVQHAARRFEPPPNRFADNADEEDDDERLERKLSYWRGVGTSHHLEQVSRQARDAR